ncbi:hypothetical protein [Methylocystis parvus]|uniref:hypothetical protein n=1 Tax=Methylocystis parvus TaxID=134 RepID=UPI003C752FA9
MTIDFEALALGPIYDVMSVSASFALAKGAGSFTLPAIDMTAGLEITLGSVDIPTIQPVAMIRAADLAAQSKRPDQLLGATVSLSGKSWRIESYKPKPGPAGEAHGEYALILVQI